MFKRGRPFEPGNKCGRGRPRGSRNKVTGAARKLVAQYGEAIVRKAILEALKDDSKARIALLPYALGRPGDLPVNVGALKTATAEELAESAEIVLQQVAAGKLTADQGQRIGELIELRRRTLETQEFARRLAALETKS
jgi:hypothetical protein